MRNKKLYLPIMIIIFISVVFSSRFFSQKYGTSNDQEASIKFQQTQRIHDLKPLHILEAQISGTNEMFLIPNEKITIAATGDLIFHTSQLISAYNKENNTYDFYPVFKKVEPYISSADLALGNFESVTAGPKYGYTGYPTFNTPEEVLSDLKKAGFDILATANNHSLDKGKEGLISTVNNIQAIGLENIGTYKEDKERILIKNLNGIKLGLLAYTYGCNGMETLLTEEELDTMVNIIDEEKIMRDLHRADELGVDISVVYIHWGNEYQLEPSSEQILLGEKMIEWGADIILGSHPHVIQKSQVIDHNGHKKFIIYSMGNFVSNQRRETLPSIRNRQLTEDGVIVILEIEKDNLKGETYIKDIKYVPTWVHRYTEDGRLVYEIIPTTDYVMSKDEDREISEEVFSRIEESYHNTINKIYK